MWTRVLGATAALILLVGAGCGTNSAPPAEAPPGSTVPAESPKPARPSRTPLAGDAYQKLLTSSETAIRQAFDGVMAAKSIKDFETATGKLSDVITGEEKKLGEVEPPSPVQAAHGYLERLLEDSQPTYQHSEPKANVCGLKPTTAEQLIQAKRSVHESFKPEGLKYVSGQFKKVDYSWGTKLLPAKPEAPAKKKRRADNGEVIERNGSRGDRFLKIKNDTSSDYVVAAVTKNPKKPMASIYVRANSDTTLYNLAAKTYTVYYKTGTDWDDDRKTFTRGCAFQKFQLSFLPKSNWEIELKKRIGGNASTEETEPF